MMVSKHRAHEVALPTLYEVLPSECHLFDEERLMFAAIKQALEDLEAAGLGESRIDMQREAVAGHPVEQRLAPRRMIELLGRAKIFFNAILDLS